MESLAETLARVEQARGKKVHGPNEILGVANQVSCMDPDGTLFGVTEPAS